MATVDRASSIVHLALSEDEAADLRGILAGLVSSNKDQPSVMSIYHALTHDLEDNPLPYRFADSLVNQRVNLSRGEDF